MFLSSVLAARAQTGSRMQSQCEGTVRSDVGRAIRGFWREVVRSWEPQSNANHQRMGPTQKTLHKSWGWKRRRSEVSIGDQMLVMSIRCIEPALWCSKRDSYEGHVVARGVLRVDVSSDRRPRWQTIGLAEVLQQCTWTA